MPPKGYKFESRKMLHGATKGRQHSPTFRSWTAMRERCYSPKHKDYQYYGGRGIGVHQPWRESFAAFLADVGERPTGMTLDRYPDQNGNYEPGNVRWATRAQQQANRRNSVLFTLNGETLTRAAWARRLNCDVASLVKRQRKGWSDEQILTTPFKFHGPRVAKHKNEGAIQHARK